jgi:1-acyl-sn-glycerol-3-phosphate acyltransferase
MIVLRSILFSLCFLLWFCVTAVLLLPITLLPRAAAWWVVDLWVRGCLVLLRVICNIRFEMRGRENLPKGGFILAAKHQSAFETMALHVLAPRPAFIFKRELLFVPVFGYYLWRFQQIAVTRGAGQKAMKGIGRAALPILAQGRAVIIFPQGTRTDPGTHHPYRSGVQHLARLSGAPVVPLALNSGLFWGRKAFLKYPGTVVFEVLPALTVSPQTRGPFMTALEEAIETATARLEEEARTLEWQP